VWIGYIWLRTGTSGGFCEHGDGSSGSGTTYLVVLVIQSSFSSSCSVVIPLSTLNAFFSIMFILHALEFENAMQ
jgi:hypothetical protein